MLKLQYFGHLMQTADSLEKTLMLEKIEPTKEGGRGLDGWIVSLIQWTWSGANSHLQHLECYSSWGRKESDKA